MTAPVLWPHCCEHQHWAGQVLGTSGGTPGSWGRVVSDCSHQHKWHAGWSGEQHRAQSPQITSTGLTLLLEDLSASRFLHLEAPWGAGVPLRMFIRKIKNFLNWADTKDWGAWCTCDKIQQLGKGAEDHSGADMLYLGVKCGSSTSLCSSRTYHRLRCGLGAKPCADTSSGQVWDVSAFVTRKQTLPRTHEFISVPWVIVQWGGGKNTDIYKINLQKSFK